MTEQTKRNNHDNGYVDMSQEAVLSGAASNRPEGICSKYPEKCSDLLVAPADCRTDCCGTPAVVKGCPECQDCPDCPECRECPDCDAELFSYTEAEVVEVNTAKFTSTVKGAEAEESFMDVAIHLISTSVITNPQAVRHSPQDGDIPIDQNLWVNNTLVTDIDNGESIVITYDIANTSEEEVEVYAVAAVSTNITLATPTAVTLLPEE